MAQPSALFDSLIARRSAKARDLTAPAPDAQALAQIVFAASRAPDHGRLVPFRFVEIPEARRADFATVLAEAAREEQPAISEPELDRARDKALEGPCILAMMARIDPAHPKIPASDQWLTAGCALENLLLAAQSMGFSGAVRSGRYLETQAVRQAFGLAPNEHFTCFIVLGTASEFPPAKPKPALEQVFSRW